MSEVILPKDTVEINAGYLNSLYEERDALSSKITAMLDTIDRLTAEARVKHDYEEAAEFYAECGPGPDQLKNWIIDIRAEIERLRAVLDYISTADGAGGELFPVGPSDTEYAEDGNTVLCHIGPWCFLHGKGNTFLDAVEDAIKKDKAACALTQK